MVPAPRCSACRRPSRRDAPCPGLRSAAASSTSGEQYSRRLACPVPAGNGRPHRAADRSACVPLGGSGRWAGQRGDQEDPARHGDLDLINQIERGASLLSSLDQRDQLRPSLGERVARHRTSPVPLQVSSDPIPVTAGPFRNGQLRRPAVPSRARKSPSRASCNCVSASARACAFSDLSFSSRAIRLAPRPLPFRLVERRHHYHPTSRNAVSYAIAGSASASPPPRRPPVDLQSRLWIAQRRQLPGRTRARFRDRLSPPSPIPARPDWPAPAEPTPRRVDYLTTVPNAHRRHPSLSRLLPRLGERALNPRRSTSSNSRDCSA